MPLTYNVSAAPASPGSIVTLNDVKKHVYADTNDDDILLQRLINSAEASVGRWTQRLLPSQTIKFYLEKFPHSDRTAIRLPVSPVQAIDSIAYLDADSAAQTLVGFQTDLISEPSRILPALNTSWPATDQSLNNVVVTATVGYATLADMRTQKQELEQAVMILVGEWYENREAAQDIELKEIPDGLKNLLGLANVATVY